MHFVITDIHRMCGMHSVPSSLDCDVRHSLGGKHTFTCDNSFVLRTLYKTNTVTIDVCTSEGNVTFPTNKVFPANSLAGRYVS